ncbi:MAG: arylsulfatase [Verrucomicrobiae bacterium]|nr:arylsulfatase [Verrucomicrobiae bacterium]
MSAGKLRRAVCLGCLWLCLALAQTWAAPRPPNFLIIVADDLGFSDVGCYGGEIDTPHLDALARDGLRYTQFYSTARCWPSRACLLTGYYAQQVRMDPPQGRLPEWTRLAPHYLRAAGYRSYHSGKWHIQGAPRRVADGGFDRSYSVEDHDRFFYPRNTLLDDQPLPLVATNAGYYSTIAIAEYAIQFLRQHQQQHRDRPFFLYLAFLSPHFPLQALPQDIAKYTGRYLAGWDVVRRQRWQRATALGLTAHPLPELEPHYFAPWSLAEAELQRQIGAGESAYAVPWQALTVEQKIFQAQKMAVHAAMVDRMDQEIGRVLAQIKAMGQADNTLTFFVSDNGASAEQIIRGDKHNPEAPVGSAQTFLCLGPGWASAANAPLRLHKFWVHEGGISSPLIVHWPAGIKDRGGLRRAPGHFIDLLPTMLDLAGIQPAPEWQGKAAPPLAGCSLAPTFAREAPLPREYLFFSHQGNRALRVGDWKLVAAGAQGPWELYDLSTNRGESRNLAAEQPAKVAEMAALWQRLDTQFREQAGLPPSKTTPAGVEKQKEP